MKLKLAMPDELYEKLEDKATAQKKEPAQFIVDNLDSLLKLDHLDHQIILNGKQLSAISMAVGGGRTIRTADDLVKLFQDNFKLGLGDLSLTLSPEDAHTLKAQYEGMGFKDTVTYDDYVKWVLSDALSLFLYGSTTGKFAYAH